MLTKTQSKILHVAIKSSKNGTSTLNWYDIAEKINIHPNIIFAAVKVLVEKEAGKDESFFRFNISQKSKFFVI